MKVIESSMKSRNILIMSGPDISLDITEHVRVSQCCLTDHQPDCKYFIIQNGKEPRQISYSTAEPQEFRIPITVANR